MNKTKQYEKGTRKELITIALAVACIPKHSMNLLPGKLKTVQKKAKEMEREGVLKEYLEKSRSTRPRIWVMYLDMNEETINACKKSCGEAAVEAYMKTVKNYRYQITSEKTSFAERWKILKNAETFMFYYGAGFQYQLGESVDITEEANSLSKMYFTSRQAKGIYGTRLQADLDKMKSVNTTRVNGLAVTEGGSYSVYNVGRYISEYSQSGEMKALTYFNRTLTMANKPVVEGAVLLAENMMVFHKFVNPETRKQQINLAGLEAPYGHIYALPVNNDGQRIMQIMSLPNWQKQIYMNTLTEEQRQKKGSMIDCDGYDAENGQYIFVFCVPDIKRLKMFLRRAEIDNNKSRYIILCFDIQKEFVQSVSSDTVRIKTTKFQNFYNYFIGDENA